MVDFQDKDIAAKRRELRKKRFVTLESGMYAGDEFLTFHQEKLFDGKISVYLPDSFIDMPEEYVQTKYIMDEIPQVIKMRISGDVVFSFQLTDQSLEYNETQAYIEKIAAALKQIQPYNKILDKGVVSVPGHDIAWLEYKGYGLDQPLYYCAFVLALSGKLMMGMFHCGFAQCENWQSIVKAVLAHIH